MYLPGVANYFVVTDLLKLLHIPACVTDCDYIVRGTELKALIDDSLLLYLVRNNGWFLCPCSMTNQPLLACSKGFQSSKLHYVHQRGKFIPPWIRARPYGWQFHSGHCHLLASRFRYYIQELESLTSNHLLSVSLRRTSKSLESLTRRSCSNVQGKGGRAEGDRLIASVRRQCRGCCSWTSLTRSRTRTLAGFV